MTFMKKDKFLVKYKYEFINEKIILRRKLQSLLILRN